MGLAQKGEGRGSLLAAAPKSAKGEGATKVALFYKASPVLLTRHQCSFTGIPTTASDVYLGPHEHSLRRAALCLIVILVLLVLLQVARPLRSAEGCCGGRIRGIVLLALLLRVAKSVEFNAYVTCSHDQIYLRSRQQHLPIGRIYNNCALGIYIKL